MIDAADSGRSRRTPPTPSPWPTSPPLSGMTAAAVYYHFPSKERVLLEGLLGFTEDYVSQIRSFLRAADDDRWVPALALDSSSGWTRQGAAAYFAHSAGLDLGIEALRHQTRLQLLKLFRRPIRACVPGFISPAEVSVVSICMLTALEVAAASWLTQDLIFRSLGRQRFLGETSDLLCRIIPPPPRRTR